MNLKKVALSTALLGSIFTSVPAYAQDLSETPSNVAASSYKEVKKTLSISRGDVLKIPSTFVRLDYDFGQVDVDVDDSLGKTFVYPVKTHEYPVLIFDETNNVKYIVKVIK